MKLKIEINLDSAAFVIDDINHEPIANTACGLETARILRKLADDLQYEALVPGESYIGRDFNGNSVLKANVEDSE